MCADGLDCDVMIMILFLNFMDISVDVGLLTTCQRLSARTHVCSQSPPTAHHSRWDVYHTTSKTNLICSVCACDCALMCSCIHVIVSHMASNTQNIEGEDGDVFLNNHVDIVISYHESSEFIVCE